jgi:hypothetical protein
MQELLRGLKPFRTTLGVLGMETTRLAAVVLSILLFGGCSQKAIPPDRDKLIATASQFVPRDASDKIIPTEIPWVQISFKVQRPPLELAIDVDKLPYAKNNGWMICRPKTEAWVSYLDETMAPPQYVQTRTYMLYRDGVGVTLVGRYVSASEDASARKDDVGSGTRTQDGIVIAGVSTKSDFSARASSQGLECPS